MSPSKPGPMSTMEKESQLRLSSDKKVFFPDGAGKRWPRRRSVKASRGGRYRVRVDE